MYATTHTTADRRHEVTGSRAYRLFRATTGSWPTAFGTIDMPAGIHAVTASPKPTNEPVNHRPTRRGAPPH